MRKPTTAEIAILMKVAPCDHATASDYLEAEENNMADALTSLRGDRLAREANDAGYEAGVEGQARRNPHAESNGLEHNAWDAGWQQGASDLRDSRA